MNDRNVSLIGIGLLGGAVAGRLLEQGWRVRGYEADSARHSAAKTAGVDVVDSAAAAAQGVRRILLSLPNSDIVEMVIAELSAALQPGQTIIDTTTGDPERAAVLATRLAERGVTYLGATVVGSSVQARAGAVTILADGPSAAVSACEDLFAALAERWFAVGASGDAAKMKLVVNLVLGLNRAALAEGLALAERLDLPAELALEVLRAGAAFSRAMDVKGQKMLDRDFTPQARLAQHLKDVHLIHAAAQRAGLELPLSAAHRRLLEESVAAGRGDLDNSAVIETYRDQRPPADCKAISPQTSQS